MISKFQLCTTLGDRKNAEKRKRNFSEFIGSVGSIFRSIRSILCPRAMVDRPGMHFRCLFSQSFLFSPTSLFSFYVETVRTKAKRKQNLLTCLG